MDSPALRILAKAVLNVLLVFLLATYLSDYFLISGGWPAYITVGALITLLNILVRPILTVIMLPFKLLAAVLATIALNGIFVWIVYQITFLMDPNIITLEIVGGIGGWIVVSIAFGIANWLMKVSVK